MLGKIPPDVFAAVVPEASERAAIACEFDANNRITARKLVVRQADECKS